MKEKRRTIVCSCRIDERMLASIVYYFRVIKRRGDLSRAQIYRRVFAAFEDAIKGEIPELSDSMVSELLMLDKEEPISVKITPDIGMEMEDVRARYLEALSEAFEGGTETEEGVKRDEDSADKGWRGIL